jgi:DNA repair exonuclease SbcCD ATPase subunit
VQFSSPGSNIYKEAVKLILKLLSLKLRNFKGIPDFELQVDGENVIIYGDNGTGKTTIPDAFNWLLFDKDSQNKKDFDIKPLDANNNPIHGLACEAEANLSVDGRPLSLRKVFSEKWTKKRGQAKAEFTGHTTDYFINCVPVQKKEYDAKISEIGDENIFKLLTSPTYFNTQLHWQVRRKTLLDVCGDISDADVINSTEKLKRLPEILQGRTLEDYRKIIAARQAEINKELEKIPVRIDEANRALPDITGIDVTAVNAEIKQLESAKQQKQQELVTAQSGGAVAEKTKELRKIEADILLLENQFNQSKLSTISGKQETLNDAIAKLSVVKRKLAGLKDLETVKIDEIGKLEKENNKRRADWANIKASTFEFEQAEVCPTCGRPLPVEELAAARETAEKAFNLDKSKKLENITNDGVDAAEKIKKLNEELTDIKTQIEAAEAELKTVQSEVGKIQAEIDELRKPSVKTTPSYITKDRERAAIMAEIEKLNSGVNDSITPLKEAIESLKSSIQELQSKINSVQQREKGERRINELKKQERELAAEFERLEGELFLTEEFVRVKVNLLEAKINSKFKVARFKLFDQQINGGLAECCETLYNGVPYSSGLNTGHRIIVGLDIIQTLSQHYNFHAPIFIDNQESITTLPEIDAQVISLVVSKPDKKLRIEYQNEFKEAV